MKWNLKFLIPVIVLAFVPTAIIGTIGSEMIVDIASGIWLVAAVMYCGRMRTRSSLWIFVLLPIAFWPFILGLLIFIGASLAGGNF